MAAGYEGPDALFAAFAQPALLEHPAMRAYVVEVDGVAVATSFGVLVEEFVGVFTIGVPPRFRRRGHGRPSCTPARSACRSTTRWASSTPRTGRCSPREPRPSPKRPLPHNVFAVPDAAVPPAGRSQV